MFLDLLVKFLYCLRGWTKGLLVKCQMINYEEEDADFYCGVNTVGLKFWDNLDDTIGYIRYFFFFLILNL